METRSSTPAIQPAVPTREALGAWLHEPAGDPWRVSILLSLPAPRGFDELRQIKKRYQRLCEDAERRLGSLGVPADEARALVLALAQVDVEPESLPPRATAVAAYAEAGRARAFALAASAPDHVAVGRAFRLRPLLAHVHANLRFRVLALAEGRVELFEGDRFELAPVSAPDVPRSLAEVVGVEIGRGSNSVQHHSSGAGGEAAVFHGHGGANRGRSVDRERFHVAVARAVKRRWAARNDPLVLVADVGHQGGFRRAADLPGLLDEGVVGSPDALDAEALRERAWPAIERFAKERDRRTLIELGDKLAHGRAVDGLEPSLVVALESRVERLWIDHDARVPGRADVETGRIVDPDGDDDAIDALAAVVLARGGEVGVAPAGELPDRASVAAELRGGPAPNGRRA